MAESICPQCKNERKRNYRGKYQNKILCDRCYQRNYKRNQKGIDVNLPLIRKKKGGYISKKGYKILFMPKHPNSNANGSLFEHVYIMSRHLNRALVKGENVHHKNGIRDDNRIENLELWTKHQPSGQRVEDKIAWAKEFLAEYGFKVMENETLVQQSA